MKNINYALQRCLFYILFQFNLTSSTLGQSFNFSITISISVSNNLMCCDCDVTQRTPKRSAIVVILMLLSSSSKKLVEVTNCCCLLCQSLLYRLETPNCAKRMT